MGHSFDPYYKWLGIPPKDQPPSHYRLLAIEPFEPDRGVIDAAANRLMAYLKSLSTGDDATLAQRLLNEVAAARRCLLEPRSKAEYDAQLRGDAAPAKAAATIRPAPPPPLAAPRSPIATRPVIGAPQKPPPLPAMDFQGDPSARLPHAATKAAKSRRGGKKAEVDWLKRPETIMTAAGVFLVALIVLICLVVSQSHRDSGEQVSSATSAKAAADEAARQKAAAKEKTTPARPIIAKIEPKPEPPSPPPDNLEANPPVIETAKATAEPPRTPIKEAPATVDPVADLPDGATTTKVATPVVSTQKPPPPPSDPLAGLGAALDLPGLTKSDSAEETAPTTLGPLPVANPRDVRFSVADADEVFGHAAKITVTANEANPDGWRVELRDGEGDPQPLAEFFVRNGQLQFAWMQSPLGPRADLFRNCLLEIAIGAHSRSFALRRPHTIDPLTILSEKGGPQTHTIDVPGVPPGACQLEVDSVSGPKPYNTPYQPPLSCSAGKLINLQWGEGPTAIYAQVSFEAVKSNGFVIQTRLLVQPPNLKNPKTDKVFSSKWAESIDKQLTAMAAKFENQDPRKNPALQSNPVELKRQTEAFEKQFKPLRDKLDYLRRLESFRSEKGLRDQVRVHIAIGMTLGDRHLEFARCEVEKSPSK